MNTLKLVAVLVCTVLPLGAADVPKRVISILEVEAKDVSAYTARIGQFNTAVKDKVGKEPYLRVFQTTFDAKKSGRLRVVADAPSIAALNKNAEGLETEIRALQREFDPTRTWGARMLYQALRMDGTSTRGGANYTTSISMLDERGYLEALHALRALLDANGMKDVRISLYRCIAGRGDHTHIVILGASSMGRLTEFLDFVATNEKASEWVAASAKYRTVVSNFATREITK